MVELHVMQGRLLAPQDGRIQAFPVDGWEREFELAGEAGVSGVEWIYEVHGEQENPLGSADGRARLRELQGEHAVKVESVCADWFMDRPLVTAGDAERAARTERLRWLVESAAAAGVERIVIPFVDSSALRGDEDRAALAEIATGLGPHLERFGVELHLETDLPPAEFAALLAEIGDARVMANYDSGNSASLGFDPREEFEAYGERIGSVHVKDRVRGGGTVPLGSGDADLGLIASLLRERDWSRPLVLQVARGEAGGEVAKTRADAELVAEIWERAG